VDNTLLPGGANAVHTIEALVYNEKTSISSNETMELIAGRFTTSATPYPSYGVYAGMSSGSYDSVSYTVCTSMNSADMATIQPATFAGKWYHLVAVFNGSVVTIYLNGESVSQTVTTTSSMPAGRPFLIGGRDDLIQFFYGAISHVAVYNTALTATQVRSHATAAGIIM
jgi:hypothetical protein